MVSVQMLRGDANRAGEQLLQRFLVVARQVGGMTMSRLVTAVLCLIVCTQGAPGAYHYLEFVSDGELLSGEPYWLFHVLVRLDDGERWRGAELSAGIGGGCEFYHHELDFDPPHPDFFGSFPDLEYSSFYTSPDMWPNAAHDMLDQVTMIEQDDGPLSLQGTWIDPGDVYGPGEFVIAQITVLDRGFHPPFDMPILVTSVIEPIGRITSDFRYWDILGEGPMDPSAVDFGARVPGHAGPAARLPVPFGWEDVETSVSGPASGDFSASPGPSDPYGTYTIAVTFRPTAYGNREATLTIGGWWYIPGDPNAPPQWSETDVPLTGYGLCPGDLDGDAQIGLSDLAILLGNYGQVGLFSYQDGDLNQDMYVDLRDLATLVAEYGTSCP